MRHLHLKVVGIAHHLDAARAVFCVVDAREDKSLVAMLLCQQDNPYDKNAVMVYVNTYHVGYIDKDHSHLVSKLIERGKIREIKCSGKVRSEKADRPWFFLDISHESLTPGKRASAALAAELHMALRGADDMGALKAAGEAIHARKHDLRQSDIDQLRLAYRMKVGQLGGHA